MDKKTIKINLSTVIYMFIIFVLLIVIIGMWHYYNNIKIPKNDQLQNTSGKVLNEEKNEISSSNNTIPSGVPSESSAKLNLGTYVIQPDVALLGEDGLVALVGDEGIEFLENDEFITYLGFGSAISGTYSISNENIVNCTITSFFGEYSPEQKVTGTMAFKIIDNSTIEITNASEFVKIQLVDTITHALTNDYKDYYLSPFIKGIKLNFSN